MLAFMKISRKIAVQKQGRWRVSEPVVYNINVTVSFPSHIRRNVNHMLYHRSIAIPENSQLVEVVISL